MNINGSTLNSTATLAPPRVTKRVILAGQFRHGVSVANHFRKLGWEVHTVASDHDVHAAVAETAPHAVLVLEDAGDESGYLACAKLRQSQPDLNVVVVGAERTPRRQRFAEFVGGVFVAEDEGVSELVAALN